jgi:hypothetical protein
MVSVADPFVPWALAVVVVVVQLVGADGRIGTTAAGEVGCSARIRWADDCEPGPELALRMSLPKTPRKTSCGSVRGLHCRARNRSVRGPPKSRFVSRSE